MVTYLAKGIHLLKHPLIHTYEISIPDPNNQLDPESQILFQSRGTYTPTQPQELTLLQRLLLQHVCISIECLQFSQPLIIICTHF